LLTSVIFENYLQFSIKSVTQINCRIWCCNNSNVSDSQGLHIGAPHHSNKQRETL